MAKWISEQMIVRFDVTKEAYDKCKIDVPRIHLLVPSCCDVIKKKHHVIFALD